MVAKSATHQNKRYGKHQRRTIPFVKTYWPYLPMVVIIGIGLTFTALWQTRVQRGVLAYATSMSSSALLQSTNQNRVASSVSALKLNSRLNQAAQSKANDMVERDYWSHNTPDGNPPWIFIDQSGYQYQAAGENLAYGFLTSTDTVAGWMNSPEHKANLLSNKFTDVGFGFANSANYQSNGPQTIVVAMYASPLYAPKTLISSAPTSSSQQAQGAESQAESAQIPNSTNPKVKATSNTDHNLVQTNSPSYVATPDPPTKSISRMAALTNGSLPWVASFTTIIISLSAAALVVRHSISLHRWIRRGERYMLHHAIFDITIVSLAGLSIVLGQTAGSIR